MRNWLRMTTLMFVLLPLWQKGQRPVLVAGAGLTTSEIEDGGMGDRSSAVAAVHMLPIKNAELQ